MPSGLHRHTWRALLAGLFLLVSYGWGVASAQSGQSPTAVHVAGIVVDYGGGHRSYALVPYTEVSLSGMELLDRSGLSLLTVEFGGMGQGVCKIERTGCDLSACRSRLCQTGDPTSPFWHYARHADDGSWELAPLGASSSVVQDGVVDGWFWASEAPVEDSASLGEIAEEMGVDLTDFRNGSIAHQSALVVTVGAAESTSNDPDPWSLITGAAVLGGVAIGGGFLVWRARRSVSP